MSSESKTADAEPLWPLTPALAASRYPNPVHRWTIAQWLKDPLNAGYVELLPEPADAA